MEYECLEIVNSKCEAFDCGVAVPFWQFFTLVRRCRRLSSRAAKGCLACRVAIVARQLRLWDTELSTRAEMGHFDT